MAEERLERSEHEYGKVAGDLDRYFNLTKLVKNHPALRALKAVTTAVVEDDEEGGSTAAAPPKPPLEGAVSVIVPPVKPKIDTLEATAKLTKSKSR